MEHLTDHGAAPLPYHRLKHVPVAFDVLEQLATEGKQALLDAGFSGVRLEMFDLTSDPSVEEYVSDRALGAGGRLGRRTLGEPRWREFLDRAEAELRGRLGDRVHFNRPVVLGVGTVA